MKTERRYDIDWVRVIAIGLLLIYHIAIIFQPWALFIGFMKNDTTLESLWTPMTMLNVWRIPLLFFVSGMGVYFAMKKRTCKQLLWERTKRIFVPFLVGFIAIVPLQIGIFQHFYKLPLQYQMNSSHLWFLGNIMVYVLVLAPVFFYLKKHENGKFHTLLSNSMRYAITPLVVSLFFMLETTLVNPQIYELYAQTWHGFYLGFIAFFVGFLFVYSGKTFWETVKKWKWIYLVIAILLYAGRISGVELAALQQVKTIETTTWILSVFGIAYSYANKPSAILRYLTNAVYPIYIIHMVVLFGSALVILPLAISPLTKLLGITSTTFVVCFLVYEFVIRRNAVLRILFGMKATQRNSTAEKPQKQFVSIN